MKLFGRNKYTAPSNESSVAIVLLSPAAAYLLAVMLMPFMWAFYISMTKSGADGTTVFAGFEKYLLVLKDANFYNSVYNTLVFTFFAVLGKVVLGIIMALVLNGPIRLRNVHRSLLIIPWALPTVISILTWKWLYSDVGGALNHLLKISGLIQTDVKWLASAQFALMSVIIVNIWRGTPFIGVSVLSGLQTVPHDLYEAATIDGANALKRFIYVTLPHIKSVIGLSAFVTTIWTINDFEIVWLLTRGGPAFVTEIISTYSYRVGFLNMDIARATAVSFLFLPLMILLVNIVTKYTLPKEAEE